MICLSPPSSLRFRFWQTAPASCTTWEPAKMLGINDFNLQNSKSVTKNFFSNEKKVSQVRWKPYCARGKAGRRQPSCRGFLLLFAVFSCCFCFTFGCLLLMWRYFCCFLLYQLQRQGPWHENATDQKWRHASG